MQIQNNGICFVSVPNVLKSNNLLDVYNTTLSLASFYNDYGFGIIFDVSINVNSFLKKYSDVYLYFNMREITNWIF